MAHTTRAAGRYTRGRAGSRSASGLALGRATRRGSEEKKRGGGDAPARQTPVRCVLCDATAQQSCTEVQGASATVRACARVSLVSLPTASRRAHDTLCVADMRHHRHGDAGDVCVRLRPASLCRSSCAHAARAHFSPAPPGDRLAPHSGCQRAGLAGEPSAEMVEPTV